MWILIYSSVITLVTMSGNLNLNLILILIQGTDIPI